MKKLIRTKSFSITQSLIMAENLKEEFRCHCSIHCEIDAHTSDNTSVTYYIYIANGRLIRFIPSWQDLQDKYFEFMSEES